MPVTTEVAQLERDEPSHRDGEALQIVGVGAERAQGMHVAHLAGELTYLVPSVG